MHFSFWNMSMACCNLYQTATECHLKPERKCRDGARPRLYTCCDNVETGASPVSTPACPRLFYLRTRPPLHLKTHTRISTPPNTHIRRPTHIRMPVSENPLLMNTHT